DDFCVEAAVVRRLRADPALTRDRERSDEGGDFELRRVTELDHAPEGRERRHHVLLPDERAAGQGVDGAEDLRPVLLVGVDVEEADPRVATVLEVAEHAADEALSAMRTGVVRLAVMTDV